MLLWKLRRNYFNTEKEEASKVQSGITKEVQKIESKLSVSLIPVQRGPRYVPGIYVDSRLGSFLLLVKDVRELLHTLRVTLKDLPHPQLRPSILTLNLVLDSFISHLKYLRRHTVEVLLSDSRVAD